MDLKDMLDMLHGYREQESKRMEQKQAMIDSVMTPLIVQEIREIEEEFATSPEMVEKVKLLTNQIKNAVLDLGETFRGNHLMAVYSKGRDGWDMVAMKKYAESHPEIEEFKKTGKPSVKFQKVVEK